MPKKRYRPEDIIAKIREADIYISQGKTVAVSANGHSIGFMAGPMILSWIALMTISGSAC